SVLAENYDVAQKKPEPQKFRPEPHPKPTPVMDEVLVPHPYMEGRFISRMEYGPARVIDRRKEQGQSAQNEVVLQGMMAAGAGVANARSAKPGGSVFAFQEYQWGARVEAKNEGSQFSVSPLARAIQLQGALWTRRNLAATPEDQAKGPEVF